MIAQQFGFRKLLVDAGLVPPGEQLCLSIGDATGVKSVLETLLSAWSDRHARATAPVVRRRAARNVQILERCCRPDVMGWTASDPRVPAAATRWLGERLWWSLGLFPAGHRIAIVSSRLPRLLDPHGTWLQALRAALERLHDQNAVAVTGQGSAGYEFVLRGASRRGIPTIVIHCCDLRVRSAAAWARYWRTQLRLGPAGPVTDLWALPPEAAPTRSAAERCQPVWTVAERDRAAVAWADTVIVLGLRSGGNLHRLLRTRLQSISSGVVLVDLPGLQSPRARKQLLQLGATLWAPPTTPASPRVSSSFASTIHNLPPATQLVSLPLAAGWDVLTHTTRTCAGSWPEQSCEDYLDSLLDARLDADHSPLAALMRIVSQRRLIASAHTIRKGYRIVSFTAVPLTELRGLRVFRSHRSRWDFEPYGICISRRWLEARGAQPVIYTGNSDWSRLPVAELPFFQYVRHLDSAKAVPGHRTIGIDWSVEREWRHVGDLDLSALAATDAILFAPTIEEARKLLEISPWAVTVLA